LFKLGVLRDRAQPRRRTPLYFHANEPAALYPASTAWCGQPALHRRAVHIAPTITTKKRPAGLARTATTCGPIFPTLIRSPASPRWYWPAA